MMFHAKFEIFFHKEIENFNLEEADNGYEHLTKYIHFLDGEFTICGMAEEGSCCGKFFGDSPFLRVSLKKIITKEKVTCPHCINIVRKIKKIKPKEYL